MTSFYLAIMPGGIRFDQLMFDPFLLQKDLKQAGIPVLLGFHKTFGKFKSVIRLDTFNPDALSGKPG